MGPFGLGWLPKVVELPKLVFWDVLTCPVEVLTLLPCGMLTHVLVAGLSQYVPLSLGGGGGAGVVVPVEVLEELPACDKFTASTMPIFKDY
jgi:hypothetical protein